MKWVGGKTKLLPELVARMPSTFGRYYEPFAGGAALFFKLAPERAVIADANADLIAMYRAVADDVEDVIVRLQLHATLHDEAHYYSVRDHWNADWNRHEAGATARAAAFIYLNKTCFNGLWRVNKAGAFNVPMGAYDNPTICDVDALRRAQLVLCGAELRTGDYRDAVRGARAGDVVYFDPPYDGTFNAYTSEGAFDQRALAETARELAARGVYVVVSNANTPLVRSLYERTFSLEVVRNSHSVNADGAGRGDVDELIITSARRPTVTRPAEQQYFDGMKPPDEPDVEEVKQAIYLWLDAQVSQKRAAEETKQKHAQMLEALKDNGLDWHPYIDPITTKKRKVFTEAKPKAKTARMVSAEPGKRGRRKRGGPSRDIDAEIEPGEDNKVESRRVPRNVVENEIDPFGATRGKMAGGVLDDAEAKQDGKPIAERKASSLPRRGKAKRGK